MKNIVILFSFFLVSTFVNAKTNIGEKEMKNFLMKQKFSLDTTAEAIIIEEKGNLTITFSERYFYYDFEYNCIAKIINENGMDITDVEVRLQPNQQLKSVTTSTISLSKGNKVTIKENDRPVTYKDYDTYRIAHLSFSKVNPGDLIRYSYTISTEKSNDFPVWNFEEKYPKIHSELGISYDAGMDIAVINSKKYNFPIADSDKEIYDCKSCRFDANINNRLYIFSKATYVRNNIPSFFIPDFFGDHTNTYGQQLKVQIVRLRNYKVKGNSANMYSFNPEYLEDYSIDNWEDANKKFLHGNSRLGALATKSNKEIDHLLKEVTRNSENNFQKAKAIYNYIRDSIETIESGGESIYVSKKTEELLSSRKGTIADKNILLVSMLNTAGLEAFPLVTCTNDIDQISTDFPAYSLLNYLLVHVRIEGKDYTLDASDQSLGFGEIKPECSNSLGIIVKKKLEFVSQDKIIAQDKNVYLFNVDFKNHENGLIKGTIRLGKYSSSRLRKLDKAKAQMDFQKQFVLSVLQQLPLQTKMLTYNVSNLNNDDSLISLDFEASAKMLNTSLDAFEPFLVKTFSYNPIFNLDPYVNQSNFFVFNYALPINAISDNLPKGKNMVLGDNQLVYKSDVSYDKTMGLLKVSYKLQSNPVKDISFSKANYLMFVDKIKSEQQLKIKFQNLN
jgi:transglutaminase-like putative cysteine protease